MATRIATDCDWHLDEDERVPGATLVISLDGGHTFYAIDGCEDHEKAKLGPLAEDLEQHGRIIDDDERAEWLAARRGKKVSPEPANHRCPALGCGVGPTIRSTMRSHLADKHNLFIAQVEAALGQTLDGKPITDYCHECGGGFQAVVGLRRHKTACDGSTKPRPDEPSDEIAPSVVYPKKRTAKKTAKKTAAAKVKA